MKVILTLISACMMATPDSGQIHNMPGGYDHLNMLSGPEISAGISRSDDFERNYFDYYYRRLKK